MDAYIRVKKAVFFCAAAFNAAFIYFFLALLGFFGGRVGVSVAEIVSLSFIFAGFQVGQSSAVQAYISKSFISPVYMYGFSVGFLILFGFFLGGNSDYCFGMLSVAVGYHFSFIVMRYLTAGEKWFYQLMLAARTIFAVAVSVILISVFDFGFYFLIFIYVLINFVFSAFLGMLDCDKKFDFIAWNFFLVIFGVVSAAIYRNDVNFVRQGYSEYDGFSEINFILSLYSLISAFVGFLVVNYVYASAKNSGYKKYYPASVVSFVYIFMALMLVVAFLTFEGPVFYYAAALAGAFCPYMSGYLHCSGRSGYVYFGGAVAAVISFFILYGWAGYNIDFVFFVYLAGLMSFLFAGFVCFSEGGDI